MRRTDSSYYTYDASGSLLSMNLNGSEYYYVRNSQGDITGIIDSTGERVVSYAYDTWGKLISITGSLASTVGEKNPYRYRGYRYGSEVHRQLGIGAKLPENLWRQKGLS